jgi:hypothetical protein
MKQSGLFPYSGNKGRYLPKYRPIPPSAKAVVEPFAGSAAISIASGKPYFLAEADPGIRDLFNTGRSVSLQEWFRQVDEVWTYLRGSCWPARCQIADDLAKLRPWQSFIIRVQSCGLLVGTACSTMLYKQYLPALGTRLNTLRTEQTWQSLRRCIDCVDDYSKLVTDDEQLAFVIDPPYFGTNGNYKGGNVPAADLRRYINSFQKSPVMVTYGDGAAETLPDLTWEVVAERSVPRVRVGGVIKRTEYVSYQRWT